MIVSTSGPIHTSAMSMSRGHMRTSLVILCNSTTIEQRALLGSSECKVGLDGSKRKKASGEGGLAGDGKSQQFYKNMKKFWRVPTPSKTTSPLPFFLFLPHSPTLH